MADLITVTRRGREFSLNVDGVEIPGIRFGSVELPVTPDDIPTVRLELIARQVHVHNTIEPESETP